MPVTSIRKEQPFIWIQPSEYPFFKVEIIGTDTTDITYNIQSGTITNGATESIGTFTITINNFGQFNGKWNGNEILKMYADYGTPTTLRFLGRIEKVSYNNNLITFTGRSESLIFLGVTVTKQYTNQEASSILEDLISSYSTGFTTTNVQTSSTFMTVNWYQKPFWDCVKEICDSASYDAYVDADKDWHFFPEKSVLNADEAIVHGMNLLGTGSFGEDKSQVRNRIIVYGQKIGDTPLIYTAEDQNSYTELGRWQEKIINDTNITTQEQAKQRADTELSIGITPVISGELNSLGLPSLNPGDLLKISDPDNNIQPSTYRILDYTHNLNGSDTLKTKVKIERSPTLAGIIKSNITDTQNLANIDNPFEMRFSYNLPFNDDTQTESHEGTRVLDGKLMLMSGLTSGTFISNAQTGFLNHIHLKVVGISTGTNYWISTDNGTTWQPVIAETLTEVTEGSSVKIKVEIKSESTQIDSLAILYKYITVLLPAGRVGR